MKKEEIRKRLASADQLINADDAAIEELTSELEDLTQNDDFENVPDELGEDETLEEIPVQEESVDAGDEELQNASDILAQADELMASINAAQKTEVPDDKQIVSEQKQVLDACNALEAKIAAMEKEDCEDGKCECKKAQEEKKETVICDDCKKASEQKPGIEDEIGDEAHGGDASVSELRDTDVDCDTYKEVFPTNSEYVAKITARLDRVANALEKKGMRKMAFRVDQLSDKLEASIRK